MLLPHDFLEKMLSRVVLQGYAPLLPCSSYKAAMHPISFRKSRACRVKNTISILWPLATPELLYELSSLYNGANVLAVPAATLLTCKLAEVLTAVLSQILHPATPVGLEPTASSPTALQP